MAPTLFEDSRRWIEHFNADVKQAYMTGLSECKDGDVKLHNLGCVPSSFSSILPIVFSSLLSSPFSSFLAFLHFSLLLQPFSCYSPAGRKSEACEARGYCSRCLH